MCTFAPCSLTLAMMVKILEELRERGKDAHIEGRGDGSVRLKIEKY